MATKNKIKAKSKPKVKAATKTKIKTKLGGFGTKIRKKSPIQIEERRKIFDLGRISKKQVLLVGLFFILFFAGQLVLVKKYYYYELTKDLPPEKALAEIKKQKLENRIRKILAGTPMEEMASYISEKGEKTASFLVGIGKKESNWGKRHPVLDGQDCFNYWGYRGQSERIGSGGHTCFDSPRQAVNVVANRINEIIKQNDVQSAKDMIVWKCGFSCDGHSDESVRKWISDVDYYAKKVIN